MLADGTYEAFVLDAEEIADGGPGAVRVEVTITSGSSKGDVLVVTGNVGARSAIDLLGVPATLVVEAGEPRLDLE